jgi:hypothetical protein
MFQKTNSRFAMRARTQTTVAVPKASEVELSSATAPDSTPSTATNDYSELLKAAGISTSSSTSNELSDLLDSFPSPPTFIPAATGNSVAEDYLPFDGSAFSASLTFSSITTDISVDLSDDGHKNGCVGLAKCLITYVDFFATLDTFLISRT